MPALDPGRGLFRAKSPPPVSTTESSNRVRSPSPPKVRAPVKVPERFKSPEPPQFKSPEPPKNILSPEPAKISEQEQNGTVGNSTVNGTANGSILGTNQMDSIDDQGVTRKKVVKVVRRVVRKVLSTEEDDDTMQPQKSNITPEAALKVAAEPLRPVPGPAPVSKSHTIPGFSFKHDVIKTEEKDDISRGLTNLMVRGRTREPRVRIRKEERPEKAEIEKIHEMTEEKIKPKEPKQEPNEDKTTSKSEEPPMSGPVVKEFISPVAAVNPTSTASLGAASSKSAHSRPLSLPPVVGFIPPPQPTPLSPPPGFIPAPKPTAAAAKPPTTNPPSLTPVTEKPSTISLPSRSVPNTKSPTLTTSMRPNPPRPSPLSPPSGIIPKQQPFVSQQEVVSTLRMSGQHLGCCCGKCMTI